MLKKLRKFAKKKGACKRGLKWLKKQTNARCLVGEESVDKGYMTWIYEYLPEFREKIMPTEAEYEAGLTSTSWYVKACWANRIEICPSSSQYERGLTDKNLDVRISWAFRTDLIPTDEQTKRGLADSDKGVRECWEIYQVVPYPRQSCS